MASTTQQSSFSENALPSPAHLEGVAYLYGHPLLNSLSPLLHETIYDALGLKWRQIPLSVSDTSSGQIPYPYTLSPTIPHFLSQVQSNPKFVGSSVTMPWKVDILPHLDEATEEATGVGACNTLFMKKDPASQKTVYVGTNTDCIGIREALLQNTLAGASANPFAGKPALIIGGGGTARAAIYTMRKWLDCSAIYIVNRDRAEVEGMIEADKSKAWGDSMGAKAELIHVTEPEQVTQLQAPVAIVSGIPNYPPKTPEEIKARQVMQAFLEQGDATTSKGVILEMCYHPAPWTDIAEMSSRAGWKVILGTEAMIWQGIEQAKLWTGKDILAQPGVVDKVKAVIAAAIAERTGKNTGKL